MKPRVGRPPKLTDEVQARIVQALEGGNFRNVACEYGGVGRRTFTEWMAAGQARPKSRFGRFRRAIISAEKRAEIRCVALVMKAAAEDARHAEWWLSHRHAPRWAEKRRVELSKDQKTLDAERENARPLKDFTVAQLMEMAREGMQ